MRSETQKIPMRDKTLLSTMVLIPETQGPWPAIIARTPYSASNMAHALGSLCDRGYAVVLQDVRGTGDSEGSFDLLRQEPEDAVDTAEWVLKQPFCDGSLGLVGLSYLAPASVSIAATFKHNVKACIWVSPVIGEKGLFLLNGAIRLHHNLPWMALRNPKFRSIDWQGVYRHLPLVSALDAVGMDIPDWTLMCRGWNRWWAGRDLSDYFRSVEAPALAHVFEANHRVRLDISSSNFPKFDRNLNTGIFNLISSELRLARQTIRFGEGAPSRMSLTVL